MIERTATILINTLFQPEGLTDSSRWSFGGEGGTTTGTRRAGRLHPGRGARTVVPGLDQVRFWHPSGVQESKATVSGGRFPFAPERPPATICQPFGLAQRGVYFRSGSKLAANGLKRGVSESVFENCRSRRKEALGAAENPGEFGPPYVGSY